MKDQKKVELQPKIAFLEVTSKCSLQCKHCINHKYNGKDLSFENICAILHKLKDGGIKLIKYTGGEPFERKDFNNIILQCENMGMNYIIYSNGVSNDINWLNSASYLKCIRVSFDGCRETHDYVRGNGNFDIVFENLVNSVKKYPNIKFVANYTVNAQNYNQIKDFDCLLTEYGLDVRLNIGFIKYAGRAIEQKELLFTQEKAKHVFLSVQQEIIQCTHIDSFSMLSDCYLENYSKEFGCPAAKEAIYITRNGDVYPCGMFKGNKRFYCGNLNYDSLDSILSSDTIKSISSFVMPNNKCTKCNAYQKVCTGGCRGNAYNTLKDLSGIDPNCIFYNLNKLG